MTKIKSLNRRKRIGICRVIETQDDKVLILKGTLSPKSPVYNSGSSDSSTVIYPITNLTTGIWNKSMFLLPIKLTS